MTNPSKTAYKRRTTRAIKSFKVERTRYSDNTDRYRIWKYVPRSKPYIRKTKPIGKEMMDVLRFAKRVELIDKLQKSDEWKTASEFEFGPIVEIGGDLKGFKIRISQEGKIWFIIDEEIYEVGLEKEEFIDLLRMMLAVLVRVDGEVDPFDDFIVTQR